MRGDAAGPKRSDYQIVEVRDAEATRTLLGQALGIRGVVRKTRHLYRAGQTRVHFDEVEGLGAFAELEVVLREGQSDADGLVIARDLMARLGINTVDLVEGAYIDLIRDS